MIPMYFGAGDRRLFGIFAPAAARRGPPRVAVLCAPWGREYLFAHRALRRLGDMLGEAGWDTFRFDYFGTGDSAGELVDADIAGWEADIEWAIDEALQSSGANKATLVGLRLGATLAARVAQRNKRLVDRLVMWDPVIDGRELIEEMLAGAVPGKALNGSASGHLVDGFLLTSAMERDIATIELAASMPGLPKRVITIATRHCARGNSKLAERRAAPAGEGATGMHVIEHIPSEPAWLEQGDAGAGALPVAVLERIRQWMD